MFKSLSTPKVMSLPGVQPHFYDFDAMLKRRVIRVLVPPSKTLFFLDKGKSRPTGMSALCQ